MKRRDILNSSVALGVTALASACGGGGGTERSENSGGTATAPPPVPVVTTPVPAVTMEFNGGYSTLNDLSFMISADGKLTVSGPGQPEDPAFAITYMGYQTTDGSASLELVAPDNLLFSDGSTTRYLIDSSNPDLTVAEAFEKSASVGLFGMYVDGANHMIGTLDPKNRTRAGLSNVRAINLDTTPVASVPARQTFSLTRTLRDFVEAMIPSAYADEDEVKKFTGTAFDWFVSVFKANAVRFVAGFAAAGLLTIIGGRSWKVIAAVMAAAGATATPGKALASVPSRLNSLRKFNLTIAQYSFAETADHSITDVCRSRFDKVTGTATVKIRNGILLIEGLYVWSAPRAIGTMCTPIEPPAKVVTPLRIDTKLNQYSIAPIPNQNIFALPQGALSPLISLTDGTAGWIYLKEYADKSILGTHMEQDRYIPSFYLPFEQVKAAIIKYILANP
jgi:hypothetical protein